MCGQQEHSPCILCYGTEHPLLLVMARDVKVLALRSLLYSAAFAELRGFLYGWVEVHSVWA